MLMKAFRNDTEGGDAFGRDNAPEGRFSGSAREKAG